MKQNFCVKKSTTCFLLCFDAVGWVTEMASYP